MIGQTISHFHVLEKIGGGGMGVVYLAENLKLKSKVALKFLPPHLATDEEAKQRFVQEAQAASALNHPNICTVHDIDETEDGQLFIAMAHYEGETLREKLERGALPTEEALDIARQVAEGLAAAHEEGIVHRDIKPANIFVTKRGRAIILDFGLAKLAGALDLTKSGSTLGTAYYMSPEQVRAEHVDHRTDVWSLGVVLYEMLAGRRPFDGDYEQAISYAILNQEPPRLMKESASVEGIVRAALHKDPKERTESAAKLAERLTAAVAQPTALDSIRRTPDEATVARRARLKIPLILTGIVGIAAVIVATVLLWPRSSEITSDESTIRLVVLPFETLGPSELEYMGRGIAEDISSRLMSVRQLELRATRSAVDLVQKGLSLSELGDVLDVDYLLGGSVQANESLVRFSPRLVRVTDDVQVWGDTYDGDYGAALSLQSRVAMAIARELGVKLGLREEEELAEVPTFNEAAYQAYLQSKALESSLPSDINKKVALLETACSGDPKFVDAQADLAKAYARRYYMASLWGLTPSNEDARRAELGVNTVAELAPGSAQAHLAQGFFDYYVTGDYESAVRSFTTADAKRSGNSVTLWALSATQLRVGKIEESIATSERGFRLDPSDGIHPSSLANLYYGIGNFDEAFKWIDRAIAIDPLKPSRHYRKALWLKFAGDLRAARNVIESAPKDTDSMVRLNHLVRNFAWPDRDFESILDTLRQLDRDSLAPSTTLLYDWHYALATHMTTRDSSARTLAWERVGLHGGGDDFQRMYYYAALGAKDSLAAATDRLLTRWSNDTWLLPDILYHVAACMTLAGEKDAAIEKLDQLRRLPFRMYYSDSGSLDWFVFDPLRDDPRLQALVVNWERIP